MIFTIITASERGKPETREMRSVEMRSAKAKEDDTNSMFLDFFGGSPMFKVIDFLLENRLRDFTKTEIAKGADISWASLFNCWDGIEKYNIVKLVRIVGRAKLYQLNESEPIVKSLKNFEMQLIRAAADEEAGEESAGRIKARRAIPVPA